MAAPGERRTSEPVLSPSAARARECTQRLSGACWIHLGPDSSGVNAIVETPGGVLVATENRGVLRYDAAHARWIGLGLDRVPVSSLLFVAGTTPRLLAGWRASVPMGPVLFASEDNGRTWSPLLGRKTEFDPGPWRILSLAADPCNRRRVYAGGSVLFRSDDGGRSWQNPVPDRKNYSRDAYEIVVSPWCDGTVWAAVKRLDSGTVLRSTDAARTWTNVGLPAAYTASLAADSRRPGRLWVGTGPVFRSDNGGTTWRQLFPECVPGVPCGVTALLHTRDDLLYAATLRRRHEAPPNPVDHPVDPSELAICVSSNGGESWSQVPTPAGISRATAMIVDVAGRLLIGTWRHGVWRVVPERQPKALPEQKGGTCLRST